MDMAVGIGLLFTAGLLGVTHGIEPDHVAGITALTQEAGSPRLSALVGGCFGIGHAILVVGWVAVAYLLFGSTAFPPVLEQVGLLIVGLVLALLSLYLGVTGMRKLVHRHDHDHDDGPHSHYHIHFPVRTGTDAPAYGDHAHEHGIVDFIKVGTVGALFTLSPPVSMIAFISVALPNQSGGFLTGVIVAYTIAIVATMAAVGSGVGAAFSLSRGRGERVHAASQVVASLLILVFAADLLVGVVPTMIA